MVTIGMVKTRKLLPLPLIFRRNFQQLKSVPSVIETVYAPPKKLNPAEETGFVGLGIRPQICDALDQHFRIITPTHCQRKIIPPILEGRDVIIRDLTGSGKTFGIILALLNKPRAHTKIKVVERINQFQQRPSRFPSKSSSPQTRKIIRHGPPCITSVVVLPSRELAFQVEGWIRSLLQNVGFPSLKPIIQVVVRGQDIDPDEQIKDLLENPPHLLVGTATRIEEIVNERKVDFKFLNTLVLDEADHLLRLPGKHAPLRRIANRDKHPKPAELLTREIMEQASSKPQMIVASATVNYGLRHYFNFNRFVMNPLFIDVTGGTITPPTISHHCLMVGSTAIRNISPKIELTEEEKIAKSREYYELKKQRRYAGDRYNHNHNPCNDYDIHENINNYDCEGNNKLADRIKFDDDDDRMLESVTVAYELEQIETGILFIPNRFNVPKLVTRLHKFGLPAKELASDVMQKIKERPLHLFGNITQNTLYVATEFSARGIDIPSISHVFILGMPSSAACYLHMAGRTGRMGRVGKVISFIRDLGGSESKIRTMLKLLEIDVKPYEHVE
ncbi:774_t:CDS:2 [Ambispora leptoticha]|uniref:RNA helicase n=1 Tax=Ambispora leptoticha TaxID=144679 RepID=A0A9N9BD63_9GLOM|nr:774_t:CDS:2 [Ambispora leptoticha]